MIQRRCDRLRFAGDIHQPRLEHDPERAAHSDRDNHRAHGPQAVSSQRIKGSGRRAPQQDRAHSRHQRSTGEARYDEVPKCHPDPEQREDDRRGVGGRVRDRDECRHQKGVDREHAAEANRGDAERQPNLPAAKRVQLGQKGRVGAAVVMRHQRPHGRGGCARKAGRDPEGSAPAE